MSAETSPSKSEITYHCCLVAERFYRHVGERICDVLCIPYRDCLLLSAEQIGILRNRKGQHLADNCMSLDNGGQIIKIIRT
ncbi:hypothetical protein BLJAPNOD_05170 [Ensifer sp. M14]|nr:hypothetical protein BLJAPNOD_05170 [Ensifer sp. M14]